MIVQVRPASVAQLVRMVIGQPLFPSHHLQDSAKGTHVHAFGRMAWAEAEQ